MGALCSFSLALTHLLFSLTAAFVPYHPLRAWNRLGFYPLSSKHQRSHERPQGAAVVECMRFVFCLIKLFLLPFVILFNINFSIFLLICSSSSLFTVNSSHAFVHVQPCSTGFDPVAVLLNTLAKPAINTKWGTVNILCYNERC